MEEVELRPNSMLITKASSLKTKNITNNNRTIEPTTYTPVPLKQPPTTMLKDPLPIKQVPAEKPKQSKKDKVIQFQLFIYFFFVMGIFHHCCIEEVLLFRNTNKILVFIIMPGSECERRMRRGGREVPRVNRVICLSC
nr:unnamed protein product [Callosobruchus chinensis]